MAKQYEYKAELIRVVDGDTVRLKLSKEIDVGFYITQTVSTEMNFRLMGIDTPEIRGEEREEGLTAKVYVQDVLENAFELRAVTYKPDKYGRWLIDLYVTNGNLPYGTEYLLNDKLVEEGYAVRYDGGKRNG